MCYVCIRAGRFMHDSQSLYIFYYSSFYWFSDSFLFRVKYYFSSFPVHSLNCQSLLSQINANNFYSCKHYALVDAKLPTERFLLMRWCRDQHMHFLLQKYSGFLGSCANKQNNWSPGILQVGRNKELKIAKKHTKINVLGSQNSKCD